MRVGRDHASRDGDGGDPTRDGARRRRIAHASAVTLYLNRCDVIIPYRLYPTASPLRPRNSYDVPYATRGYWVG